MKTMWGIYNIRNKYFTFAPPLPGALMKKFFTLSTVNDRIFGLDVIRAVAVMFVMLTHSGKFVPKAFFPFYEKFLYDGVGIFFVLSGFLIGGILIRQIEKYKFNGKALLHFWVKRWSRTLPNYYLFLAVFLFKDHITTDIFAIKNYLSYFFFGQNFTQMPHFYGHSWSLSVEEWFYVSIPLVLFVLAGISPFKFKYNFLFVSLFIIIGVTCLRDYKVQSGQTWETFRDVKYSVLYRFDSLMYGMLGAWTAYYFPMFWNGKKRIFLIFAIFLLCAHFVIQETTDRNNYALRASLLSLTSATVLLFLPYYSTFANSKCILRAPVIYISLISYSLYLVNPLAVQLVEQMINWEYLIAFSYKYSPLPITWAFALLCNYALSWIISILFAILIFKYFELPTTTFLRRKIQISLDKR